MNPFCFSPEDQVWRRKECPLSDLPVTRMMLLTYNVWFSEFEKTLRQKKLFEIVHHQSADLIGFEEATPEFLAALSKEKWIRGNYFLSDATGATLHPHGVLLLSRFPVKSLRVMNLKSAMSRKVILCEFVLNQKSLKIAVAHLDSKKTSREMRAKQLISVMRLLQGSNYSVLMGDLNFDANEDSPENQCIPAGFIDPWPLLHPDDPGYSINPELNRMRLEQKADQTKARSDRILFYPGNGNWRVEEIELIGKDFIRNESPSVFPSDHFGLCAKLQWSGG